MFDPSDLRMQCMLRGAPVSFTVTKKSATKAVVDMNFKAWDNNEAAYGVPFWLLLVLKLCGRLWTRMTSGLGFYPHTSVVGGSRALGARLALVQE